MKAEMAALAIIVGALLVSFLFFQGCKGIPVEICYDHPKYGKVCVKLGGETYYRDGLTPEQRKEIDGWIKAGAPPTSTGDTSPTAVPDASSPPSSSTPPPP